MLYLAILMYALAFAGVAMTVNEGLWSNTISLFCIILGTLIAVTWGFDLGAAIIDAAEPSAENAWAFNFAAIWGLFAFSVTLLRVITDRLSRVRMRFVKPLDQFGGILMGFGVATMYASFVAITLFIPFNAQVWKTAEAPAWQQQTIARFAAPTNALTTNLLGVEFSDLLRQGSN
jgi:hypothetical protein